MVQLAPSLAVLVPQLQVGSLTGRAFLQNRMHTLILSNMHLSRRRICPAMDRSNMKILRGAG